MDKREMAEGEELVEGHPMGEGEMEAGREPEEILRVDTYGGKMTVEWDPDSPVTAYGRLPFFIEFLKTAGLFDRWVEGCPIKRVSPNAPGNVDVIGTLMLAVLTGQNRYAHISGLRNDKVSPGLLGMTKMMSEDAARRAFIGIEEKECDEWMINNIEHTYLNLLMEAYILDVDSTVKPIYGKQEGAEIGYNPHKPGRPSHVYHSYFIAGLRLAMDVEVTPGNETSSKYSQPGLWKLIDGLPANRRPWLVRGDSGFGNESMIVGCESRNLNYLFKLRMTKNVKRLTEIVAGGREWIEAGQGWEGLHSELQLQGWRNSRRVVVLRRKLEKKRKRAHGNTKSAPYLPFLDDVPGAEWYEYAVLVTNVKEEIRGIAQLYRDRADAENNYDELKNQWGWGGYTTRDINRCQIMARIVALVYNWWSIYIRLAVSDQHLESKTSRPLLLNATGRQTKHAGQTTIKITSSHAKAAKTQLVLVQISKFFKAIKKYAEQLANHDIWLLILSAAFRFHLKGRVLRSLPALSHSPP
jgi:hypothetical protein